MILRNGNNWGEGGTYQVRAHPEGAYIPKCKELRKEEVSAFF